MNKQREAMQFALETLEDVFGKIKIDVTAINMLREALAEPEQEPVYQISLAGGAAKAAWIDVDEATYYSAKMDATYMARCLYAAPPARQPLTDEEIDNLELPPNGCTMRELVRAVERAHGIGDE